MSDAFQVPEWASVVFDEAISMIKRLAQAGVPDETIARVIFGIGVNALRHKGLTVAQIQAEVASLTVFTNQLGQT